MILTAATSKGEKFLWQGHTAGNASEQDTVQPEIIIFICNKVNFSQEEYIENVAAIICSSLQERKRITCSVKLLCSFGLEEAIMLDPPRMRQRQGT